MSLQELLDALRARHDGVGQGREAADLEEMALLAGKAIQQREQLEQRFAPHDQDPRCKEHPD